MPLKAWGLYFLSNSCRLHGQQWEHGMKIWVLNGIPSGQYKERDSSPSRLKLGEDVISETSGAKCDWAVSKSVCVCVIGEEGSGTIRKARGHNDSMAYDQKERWSIHLKNWIRAQGKSNCLINNSQSRAWLRAKKGKDLWWPAVLVYSWPRNILGLSVRKLAKSQANRNEWGHPTKPKESKAGIEQDKLRNSGRR